MLNEALGNHFEMLRGFRMDKLAHQISDSDVESIVEGIMQRMNPETGATAWDSFARDMNKSQRALARKSQRDFERLGLPNELGGATNPILTEASETLAVRLTASLTKRATNLAKRLTQGRNAATASDATAVVKAMKDSGLNVETIAKYSESVGAEARARIKQAMLDFPDGRRVNGAMKSATQIATDQMLSTNAAITKMKMKNLGITTYEWVTQRDELVRDWHAELDETHQDFEEPPMGGGTTADETGNPGDGFNCRCGSFPIMDFDE